MNDEDIIMGEQYRWGKPDGPVVTVVAKHQYIDDHYYIKFEVKKRFDSSRRELLFPLVPFTNHKPTLYRYPWKSDD